MRLQAIVTALRVAAVACRSPDRNASIDGPAEIRMLKNGQVWAADLAVGVYI